MCPPSLSRVSTALLLALAATAQTAGDDLVPAAAVPVTWRLDVGCGFSGWFSEVLGIAAPLSEALPLLWLRTGTCSEGFHEWQAFPGESGAVRRLTHRLLSGADQCGADDDPQGLLHATDLEDGDLPRGRAAVASPAHCAALCTETTPACGAWTHRSSDGACFLKTLDAAHRQLAAPGHVSGVVAAAPSRPRPITVLHGRCDPAVVPRLVADARPGIVVGRWMFESPQLQQYGFGYDGRRHAALFAKGRPPPAPEVECASLVDEVWVPSAWHAAALERNGVPRAKVFVIGEAVDAAAFDPALATAAAAAARGARTSTTRFLSVFKWEHRKGWDVLLDAYFSSFTAEDDVVLVLRAWLPPWEPGDPNLLRQVTAYAARRFPGVARAALAAVEWSGPEDVSRAEMRDLYAAADAFLLPSRGEGWGLPAAEAAAMELPVIAPQWSGLADFVTAETGYLVAVLGTDEGGFARPSAASLAEHMRHVVAHPEEAREKGRAGRRAQQRDHSPQRVVAQIAARVEALANRDG